MNDEEGCVALVFLAALLIGLGFLFGLALGRSVGQSVSEERARKAGVGCYDEQSGEFKYDEDCPAKEASDERTN